MTRRLVCSFAAVLFAVTLAAQQSPPAPEEFLGYGMGERFTPHHRIVAYFEELASKSDRVRLTTIGETWEHRPLILAAITSPKNFARLDAIRADVARITRGEADAASLAKTSPAIVWLAFGVHGNESSSAEAAMWAAATLVRDPSFERVLDDLVVVIDPLENPDGRERYVSWFRRASGSRPDADPDASEHQEPWPGGRFNHYLNDMNRDWTWLSQQETRARVAAYRTWNPQVAVDFHEMSYQSSYFFPPSAKPVNANLPKAVEDWLDVFGRANAAEFSRRAWPFFVGERYDLFYPGYGDAWPSLHGAIGMTYEMAGGGRAGLAIERADGTVLTLHDRAERHLTTALTTVRTAAANRQALLEYSWQAARGQIDGGKNTFLVVPGSPNFDALVDLLRAQGIRVDTLAEPLSVRATRVDADGTETHAFPAGTAVVSTRQPLGALANTLLERTASLQKAFVDEQRAKAEADEPDDFYDLTAWAVPLAMNVEAWSTTAALPSLREYQPRPAPAFAEAQYAWAIDAMDPAVYRLAGRLFSAGINFSVSEAELSTGDRTLPRGSLVILKGNNAADLDARLKPIVEETKATAIPLQSGWSGGTALGSERIRHVRRPRIGLAGGPGSDPTSYGMLWHTLDADTPIPHVTLTLDSLRSIDLHDYDVLILPDGNYGDRLGSRAVEKIKRWVADGGTIVAIKNASAFLREKDVELSKLKQWEPAKKKDEEEEGAAARYNDYRIPGAAFRTQMSERSYLTFGVPRPPAVLIEGSNALRPVEHKVDNIVTVAAKDALLAGVAWDQSIERVQGSVYLVTEPVGKGQIVTFADEPNFRHFWRGTLPLFLNAVVYSKTFTR